MLKKLKQICLQFSLRISTSKVEINLYDVKKRIHWNENETFTNINLKTSMRRGRDDQSKKVDYRYTTRLFMLNSE